MTSAELEQVKADVENGVMISRETWKRVLYFAISALPMQDAAQIDSIYPFVIMQSDALYPGYKVPAKEIKP